MPLGAVPFPFGICRICKDKATGLHYGVATCEGCKGFFKRSISKQENFKCYFGGSCDVNPKTRSQCKACRFKRCLETGMSVDGVRMGRIPKVEKDKVLEAFHDGGSHFSNHELVVQQTNGGNYKFELNKTNVTSTSTSTAAIDVTSGQTSPDDTETGNGSWCASETSREEAVPKTSLKSEPNTINVKDCAIDNDEEFKENPFEIYSSKNINTDLARVKESIRSPIQFTPVSDKVIGGFSSSPSQTATCAIKDTVESERCENPFNDKYFEGNHNINKRIPKKTLQSQNKVNDQRLAGDLNEPFHQLFFSEPSAHSFDGQTMDFDETLPYNQQESSSKKIKINSQNPPCYTRPYQNSIASEMDNKVKDLSFVCEDNKQIHAPIEAVTFLPKQQKGSAEAQDQSPRRRTSFSPALINVLLEQVLESQESVSVIAEKIHQKQQQGNFSQHFAQNLSQRLTEMSAKRRRLSDATAPTSVQNTVFDDSVGDKVKQHDLNGKVSLAEYGSMYSNNVVNQTCSYSDSHHGYCGFASCLRCSSFPTHFTNMAPGYGKPCAVLPRTDPLVCNGTVSSSTLSAEEEAKTQEIRNTLDGINIAMKILNRLKPEHREKIRQFKLGKIHIRLTTDNEEDIKETYTKLIAGIPPLNERILGFCNSVPGFQNFTKSDQDTLMKRAYYDLWMLCYSEYFQDGESYMLLDSGDIYSKPTMRKILNDEMVEKLFEFATEFNRLELKDIEVAVLCAARLTSTEGLELCDRSSINKLHSHLLDVLAFEVKQNHEVTHARKLIDIFRLMPLLEKVNRIQRDIISKFSVKM